MNNYKKAKQRKNRLKVKSKAGLALLTIFMVVLAIVIPAITNIGTNEANADTKQLYDVILFFGQSNMVGSEDKTTETRHLGREVAFAGETNTDLSIVQNIEDCGSVNIGMPSGIAYEYLYYKEGSTTQRNGLREIKRTSTGLWPTGENLEWNGTGITAGYNDKGTYTGYAMNMVPQFCKTYYEKTGHRVLAVVCAAGGRSITCFQGGGDTTTGQNIGDIMTTKFNAAVNYANSRSDWKVGNKFFVSFQGENDVGGVYEGVRTKDSYKAVYKSVVSNLRNKCGITKGAVCEVGFEIPYYGSWEYIPGVKQNGITMAAVNEIYQAHQELISEDSNLILGSNYAYNSFVPNTEADYNENCFTNVAYTYDNEIRNGKTYKFREMKLSWGEAFNKAYERMDARVGEDGIPNNKIHFSAASLCQIGMEAATSMAGTIKDVNLKLSPTSGTCVVGDTKNVAITRTETDGVLGCESTNNSVATASINGNTLTITAKGVGVANIWVASHPTAALKAESTYYQINVSPRKITIPTLSNTSKTYNGSAQSPTINNMDNTYVSQTGTVSNTDAGTYQIVWNLRDTANTQWSDGTTSQKSDTWTIAKRSVTIPTITNASKTYNGSVQGPTINNPDSAYINQGGTTSIATPGTYVITWNLRDNKNCTWSDGTTSQKSATWTIGNASGLAVSAEGYENTYDGKAHGITVTCDGASIVYGTTNGTYNLNASPTYTDVGTYTVYYKVSKAGYNDVTGSRTVKINPKSVTIPKLSSASKTYTGTTQAPTISNPDDAYINQGGTVSSTNAGTYSITWDLRDNKNYRWSDGTTSQKTATWFIIRRSVTIPTITNISKTYNGSSQGPTINNPDSTYIDQTGNATAINAGTYSITWSLKDDRNYQWSDGTLTSKSVTWTIANSDGLKVTVAGYENAYDGAAHGITVTCDGATITYKKADGTYSLTASPTYTNVGTYQVYYKVTKNNYNPVTGSAIVKITPKSISNVALSLDTNTYTYDGNQKKPTPTVTDGTTVLKIGTHYTVAYSNNENAGTATVTVSGIGNYTGQKSITFTIEKATPKITLSKTTETINVDDTTTFTASVTQGAGALSVSSSAESVATATINNGTVTVTSKAEGLATITVTSAVSTNYKSTNATFALVVEKGTLRVTATGYNGTYDGASHGISVACNGATIKYGTQNGTYNLSSSPTYADAGTYTIYFKVSKSNYNDITGSQTVTIGKKKLEVTAESKNRKYGEKNPELTYKCSGNVSGQTPKLTGTLKTDANENSTVGSYSIVNNNLTLADNGTFKASNYSMTFNPGTLTIGKAIGKIELIRKESTLSIIEKQSQTIEAKTTGKLSATSSDSKIATVHVEDDKVTVVGVKPGTATINIKSAETTNYEAVENSVGVTVVENTVTKIQIKQAPKTSYIEGQELDVTNGKITITYLNGTTAEMAITSDMVTGFNKNKVGEQTLTITYGGKTTTYTVVVRQKQATAIEVQSMPTKTTYIQNHEKLDLSGAKIKVTYDNGTSEILNVTSDMVTGFDNSKVGVNKITITYQGKTSTIDLRIIEKSITAIEIEQLPTNRSYVKDYGILDVTGGKIKVKFDDNTTTLVDMTKEMVSGFDNTKIGTQTLTVEYADHRVEYQVEVVDAVITKIAMQSLPTKTTYIQNYETLDLTGAKLAITFNDTITNTINVLEEMVSGFDNTKLGTNTIKVSYAEKETSFDLTIVKHSVVKAEIDKMPNKVEYKQGEKLELTGGKVKVFYNDETSEIIDMDETMLSGEVDLTTAGSKVVKIKVENQEIGFEIKVAATPEKENNNNDNNEDNPGNANDSNNQNNSNNGNSNKNNSNGSTNNNSQNYNNSNQDGTIATKNIPQTGVNPGVAIGITALTAIAGFGIVKAFKYRFIK